MSWLACAENVTDRALAPDCCPWPDVCECPRPAGRQRARPAGPQPRTFVQRPVEALDLSRSGDTWELTLAQLQLSAR